MALRISTIDKEKKAFEVLKDLKKQVLKDDFTITAFNKKHSLHPKFMTIAVNNIGLIKNQGTKREPNWKWQGESATKQDAKFLISELEAKQVKNSLF